MTDSAQNAASHAHSWAPVASPVAATTSSPGTPEPTMRLGALPAELEVRDMSRREIGLRIVPWDTVVETKDGLEQIPVPAEGTAIQLPKITQHTEVDVQSAEKTDVASRALKTDFDTFNMVTVAGAVDVALQFLKRAPAAIRALLFDDMAAEYAAVSDSEALDALLAAGALHDGGLFDPDHPELGQAFINAYAVNRGRLPADTMWLSTNAVGAFIDAQDDNANKPLYGSIQASASVPGGLTGSVRGLKPVHVPALTDKGVDIIVATSMRALATEPSVLSGRNVDVHLERTT